MSQTKKRCAIYTRKSTEEGLDQAFNSLDAQAESCSAYILSQAGEGWTPTGQIYSDGGISGGHMERPGLQALIGDIEAGQIDIVVVYKVDRLTRSLADFAKLVDVFDRHEVSFVSITQAFNTTTSMGRLTLNVLLSFAQFEREVTAERIRDKIAASKKRGQWMGGLPPLGYDNINKQLVVNEAEADTVRHIMTRYVELGSVRKLKDELDQDGYVTKPRVTRKKSQIGGKPFSRGHLYKLLSNPVYIGKIRHKDEVYKGQHIAIVNKDLWKAVQANLETNAPKRRRSINIASNSLLTGLLYDQNDQRLSPIHSKKPNGRRYRYYISASLAKGEIDNGTAFRLPAKQIEKLVVNRITDLLSDTARIINVAGLKDLTPHHVSVLKAHASELNEGLKSTNPEVQREALIDLVQRIHISPKQIRLTLRRRVLINADRDTQSANGSPYDAMVSIQYPFEMKRRGVETKLIIGGQALGEPDRELIKLVATSRRWYVDLKTGIHPTIGNIAKTENIDIGDVSRALKLAFLSPCIVSDFIHGKHPVDLTAEQLRRVSADLPLDWKVQRAFLGMQN
jgi:site-specific DNA recombinase